jgi:hypothetical protein
MTIQVQKVTPSIVSTIAVDVADMSRFAVATALSRFIFDDCAGQIAYDNLFLTSDKVWILKGFDHHFEVKLCSPASVTAPAKETPVEVAPAEEALVITIAKAPGVYFNTKAGKWQAQYRRLNAEGVNKTVYVGQYDSQQDAIYARRVAMAL